MEQFSLVVVDVTQLRSKLILLGRLNLQVTLIRVEWLLLLAHERDALHWVSLVGVPQFLDFGCGSGDDFWLGGLGWRVLLIRRLQLPLDMPSVNLRSFEHLKVVYWNVRLCFLC